MARTVSTVYLPDPDNNGRSYTSAPIRLAASASEGLLVKATGRVGGGNFMLQPGEQACFEVDYVYEEDEDGNPQNWGNRFRVWKRSS